ncbi:ankyrin repeat domain-containing protein [Tahibacter amnicola]|uniref:Ankyrin repeat domain-containing protein n=1 Tax=Tahibacter amnicola TaxID=2976241 RepID=A0ABY6BIT6_9GAMM|nr:ankyrin repeat domain-containing protein [Tahibacter amnicola]UXI68531.1 ankyrin repeat domain-containing protein [Tahibacter amnicola]
MPRSKPSRLGALIASLPYFLPAAACLVVAGMVVHPAVLLALLAANSLTLAAVCHGLGFDLEADFARTVLRRGAAHFVLVAGYSALLVLMLGWPLGWLLREPSLVATLALSTAVVVALLALWRIWPAFGLVLVWDDAYPEDDERSWIATALSRSLTFSLHLTREHELYFSHGLWVGLIQLLLACAAAAIAGLGGVLPNELRLSALVVYGLVLLPVGQLLVANRTLRAVLTARRSRHAERAEPVVAEHTDGTCASPAVLPGGLSRSELDTALLHAARCGQVELAIAALERGADPNTVPAETERDQRSVLMLATTLPEVRLLRALIARSADVNRCHAGLTPLLAATRDSYEGRPDAVLTLLANGANPALADAQGNTALHYAALASEPVVAAMLLDAGASMACINRDGLTPPGQAAAAANWTLLRFFLEHGAKNEVEHAQPLLLSASGITDDDITGAKLLLKQKARPDAQGPMGRTALMAAALAGHAGIVRLLLDAGASVDIADGHATTALMEAARAGAPEVIALIAQRKPDPNRVDHLGRTALVIACQSRQARADTVRALLALGIDRRRPCGDGRCALDHAITTGRWDLVALIDPDYPLPASLADAAGTAATDSPAHLLDALRFGHWTIADSFIEVIRSWSERDLAGIWQELATHGDPRARQWLLNHGLRPDAYGPGGRLLDAAVAQLPDSLAALEELVHAGAGIGGSGLLRRVLDAARHCEDAPRRQRLLQLARELVDGGADPFDAGESGETAVHIAAQLGALDVLDALLERGADPNHRDARGRTALALAMALPVPAAEAIVMRLVHFGADPEIAGDDGETPLGRVLGSGASDLTRWLHWPNWPLPRRRLWPADLVSAATQGDRDAVRKLLALKLPIEATDGQGATALLRACGQGHRDLVDDLLKAGADPNHAATSGATCLSAAISARREAVVACLVGHGVDVNARLPGGTTALMIASALGFPELVLQLLQAGADPQLADDSGATALHAAVQYGFAQPAQRAAGVLETLLRAGAAPNARNGKGQTPLLLLVGGRADPGTPCDAPALGRLVAVLLDYAADLDVQDERGVSALHACAIHGLLGCARQLLARGADRELRDCRGRRPADLAELLGYADVAAELGATAAIPSLAKMLRQPVRPPE